MPKVNYKKFIEENFLILDKQGLRKRFVFNDTQNYCYDLLKRDYPTMQGIRENWLKFRQPGLSSFIDGIFTADFILSALGHLPVIMGKIYSHKDDETEILFRRVEYFLESFCLLNKIDKSKFVKSNTSGRSLEAFNGAMLDIGTAGSKVSGRGGTYQNLHWSEVAFYPNTPVIDASKMVPAAEEQVAMDTGKIFREFTGNIMYDFAYEEYDRGKRGKSQFKSRFLGWWLHKEYRKRPPKDFVPDDFERILMTEHHVALEQIYWRRWKIETAKDPELAKREYPNSDLEAFLSAGTQYFNSRTLIEYERSAREPIVIGQKKVEEPVPVNESYEDRLSRITSAKI